MHGCRAGERVSPMSSLFFFPLLSVEEQKESISIFCFPLCGLIGNVIGPEMMVRGRRDGAEKEKPCEVDQCITLKIIFHCYSCLLLQGELPCGTWLYSF